MLRKTLILAIVAGASLLVAGTGTAFAHHHGGGCGYEGGCGGYGGHLHHAHHHMFGCGCQESCGCGAPAPSCGCGAPMASCAPAPAPAPSCCARPRHVALRLRPAAHRLRPAVLLARLAERWLLLPRPPAIPRPLLLLRRKSRLRPSPRPSLTLCGAAGVVYCPSSGSGKTETGSPANFCVRARFFLRWRVVDASCKTTVQTATVVPKSPLSGSGWGKRGGRGVRRCCAVRYSYSRPQHTKRPGHIQISAA